MLCHMFVFFVGRCYALFIMIWQMLLPMFETVVISHSLICGRCCKPLWQMEMPLYCFGYHSRLMLLPIKEALYIRVNDPSLNRNVGKYHLPHVWDEVLVNTSELKLK